MNLERQLCFFVVSHSPTNYMQPYRENADFSNKCTISRDSCVLSKINRGKNFFSIKFSFHSIHIFSFLHQPTRFIFIISKCASRNANSWRFAFLGAVFEIMEIKHVSWCKNYENIMTEKKILWRRNFLPSKFLIKRTNLEISRIW